jgi:hypothetical protein
MSGDRESAASAKSSGRRSIAAARSVGLAQTGDNPVAMYVEKAVTVPPEALALPAHVPRTVNLPDRAGDLFVGRERELRLLDEAFAQAGGVAVHAVHGLGGIGKSTLAAHWAGRRVADFNPVWWITAESRADLDAGLAELARALHPALVGTLAEEALREATLQWLSANEGWLLVLDNVSDPADVKWLVDRTPNGRFLITTRQSGAGWRGVAELLDLDVLELDEAVRLFTRIYDGPDDGVEELCTELGRLPLAVDQAAAYCREAGITPRTYLEWLGEYPGRLFAATTEGGDGERTVARVWQMTLDRLADTPLAERILRVIAWWAPEGIPRELLADLADPLTVTDALRRLSAHSMIKLDGDMISVHRLVQAVARTSDGNAGAIEEGRRAAVRLLDDSLSRVFNERSLGWLGRLCAEHTEALAVCAGDDTDEAEIPRLFARAGSQLTAIGAFTRAVALCERAVTVAGPDHAMYHRLLRTIATACNAAGQRQRAVALREQVLAELERTLGTDDPEVIGEREKLLRAKLPDLDPVTAADMAQEHLERTEQVLGTEHPLVFSAAAVLMRQYRRQVESGAKDHGAEVVRTIEGHLTRAADTLEPGAQATSLLRWELIDARVLVGDTEGAVAAAEELVDDHREHFGPVDSRTLYAKIKLALTLAKAGEVNRARTLAVALLKEMDRILADSPTASLFRDELSAILDQAPQTD